MSIKFSHFILILVAVPLLFALTFNINIFVLLQHLENSRSSEIHARELMSSLNQLVAQLMESSSAAALGSFSEEEDVRAMYGDAKAKIKDECNNLLNLAHNDPTEEAHIKRILSITDAYSKDIENVRESLLENDTRRARDYLLQAQALQDQLLAATQDTARRYQSIEQSGDIRQRDETSVLNLVLSVGTISNAVLVTCLLLFFNFRVLSRLRTVKDNTIRLAADQPLHRALHGSDEFAELDRFFRKMAATLAAVRNKERVLLEYSPDVICSFDAKARFTAVSPACKSLWGYAPSDLLGSRWSQIVPGQDVAQIIASIKETSEAKVPCVLEMSVQRKDGTAAAMLWSGEWSDELKSLFFVAHDITEAKKTERARAEFTRMLRDDLKKPLVKIKNVHQKLGARLYGQFNEAGEKRLLIVQRELQRLIALVNNLLDVHKLGSELDLHIEQTQLESIITASISSVEGLAQQRNIRLLTPTHALITLRVDRERLIQVLVNLMSNAIKFSPPSSPVSLTVEDDAKHVTISVIDNGRGIPANMTEQIFERFKQVEKGDAQSKGGSGLGLAICKAIVEQHGGKIGVSSEVGKGSTFWLQLPKSDTLTPALTP